MTYHERLLGTAGRLERKDNNGGGDRVDPGVLNAETKKAIDGFMRTIEEFKSKNDEHLKEIGKKKVDDVVLREHVDRINGSIDTLKEGIEKDMLEVKRQLALSKAANDKPEEAPEVKEYSAKWQEHMRKGSDFISKRELREYEEKAAKAMNLDMKALSAGSDTDGGYTVLPNFDQTLRIVQVLVSPVRSVAQVQTIGNYSTKFAADMNNASAGWVGETDPRTATNTPQLADIEIIANEMYAFPFTTQQMLDDSYINVESWLAEKVAIAFAQKEGNAFVVGDGVKKPRGFLTYPTVVESSWAWGKIGYVPTGAAGDFTTQTATAGTGGDVFFDIIANLKYPYRQNARWTANRRTVARMRKIKTQYADYLWVPGLQNGQADTFAGYPLTEMEDMPDLAANSLSVAFGDWKQAYLIADRVGVRVLRDPFTVKGYVGFYTTKRVGGGVQNFEAFKVLKSSVS
ncbi:MAG: phage major capsid protein [Phenylobacterium zucineum]|nr:MAG: phage major capsid protein [Phenylobacterium zucineum]